MELVDRAVQARHVVRGEAVSAMLLERHIGSTYPGPSVLWLDAQRFLICVSGVRVVRETALGVPEEDVHDLLSLIPGPAGDVDSA